MKLPDGWASVPLLDLGTWYGGGTPSKANEAFWTDGTIPWVSPKDMKRHIISSSEDMITPKAVEQSATSLVPADSVLMVVRSGILAHSFPVAINSVPVTLNQDMKALRPGRATTARFTFWAMRAHERQLLDECRKAGTTVASINTSELHGFETPLPPLNEQRRIVDKIEALTARSRRAKEALDAVPPLLDKLRQSILAAAFRGDLTKEWRAAHPDVEPASVLLDRIRKERRARWEEAELAKMRAKGSRPKDDKWKSKYVEPEPVNTDDLPELPEGWAWANWGLISDWITYGFTRPMPHVEAGIPIVTAKHVTRGVVTLNNTDLTTEDAFSCLSQKDIPKPGDILVTKDGTLGRAAVVPEGGKFCINQSVAVIWLRDCPLDRQYLLTIIESPYSQARIQAEASGMTIKHLSVTDFAKMPFPLAPLQEQPMVAKRSRDLYERTQALFSVLSNLDSALDTLDSAILAKAFRGELVPQDPNDEPASALLERIRAERESGVTTSPTKKTRAKRAAKTSKSASR